MATVAKQLYPYISDVNCSVDTLLCHDDELEGRRIAFIYYLLPEWTREDGGKLFVTELYLR